ncbi:hypothetical protein JCM8097_002075 [Rhodosporidiobolus ruineniae]
MASPYGAMGNQSAIQAAMDAPSYPNPNVQGNPYIYLAVYSSVPVYEMMVRGIGVMRRRADSWLNATQILKVAGVDKGKRTKILEKDIAQGVHEKVQGGYGRYQGTWIPFERAVELANAFGVSHLLAPLFDYTAPPPPVSLQGGAPPPAIQNPYANTQPLPPPPPPAAMSMPPPPPPHPQDAAAILHQAQQQGLLPATPSGPIAGPSGHKRMSDAMEHEEVKRLRTDHLNGYSNGAGISPVTPQHPPQPHHLVPTPPPAEPEYQSNFRTTLTFFNKPPQDLSTLDPALVERHRSALKSIFAMEAEQSAAQAANGLPPSPPPDLSTVFPADLDPDTPIDEQQHTALHWASALARTNLVHSLVAFGADLHRGNNVGETPLIRAVLVTNNFDQDSFLGLVEVLAPSLRTVDAVGRSVLHHAALVAGVKGRAASAAYYLESVLEYVARAEKGLFRDLIDARDSMGDTALNIAARVGNKRIVTALLEAGADKLQANKLGLRPIDYGLDDPDLTLSEAQLAMLALPSPLPSTSDVPSQTSRDVLAQVESKLSSISTGYEAELATKTADLDEKRRQVQDLTRQLAEQRREQAQWKEEVRQTDEQSQRVKNLFLALEEEDAFDWTGRTEVDGSPATPLAGPGFTYRGPGSTLANLPSGAGMQFDTDPPAPETEHGVSGEALVHLLRLQAWYERVEGLMQQRVDKLEGGNVELETKLRKMVASIVGIAEEQVDESLEGLLASLTDSTSSELNQAGRFMGRLKDGAVEQLQQ